MEEQITRFLREHLGWADVSVSELERIPGGYVNETFACVAERSVDGVSERHSLILRRSPPDEDNILRSDRSVETTLMQALAETIVPVPKVWGVDAEGTWLDRPTMVMERVVGMTQADLLFDGSEPERLERVKADFLEHLCALHAVDWRALPLEGIEAPADWESYMDRVLADCEAAMEQVMEGYPALADAVAFLRYQRPEPAPLTILHGDYQAANFVYDDDGIRAIFDWELGASAIRARTSLGTSSCGASSRAGTCWRGRRLLRRIHGSHGDPDRPRLRQLLHGAEGDEHDSPRLSVAA